MDAMIYTISRQIEYKIIGIMIANPSHRHTHTHIFFSLLVASPDSNKAFLSKFNNCFPSINFTI